MRGKHGQSLGRLPTRRQILLSIGSMTLFTGACHARGAAPDGTWLEVNGDRQWLSVRGPDSAPLVLILHGGPGGSETVLFRHFNRALEDRFRMVYWDQRGAGRSFDAAHPPSGMTVAQFVRDLGVVVGHLRADYGAPVVLLGHSWGSALGMLYLGTDPGAVEGFIGVAQIADQAAQERASYAFALAEAHRRGNARATRQLEAIGAPPYDVPALYIKNRWVAAFGGYFAPGFDKMGTFFGALLHGEIGLGEVRHLIAANDFSLHAMWRELGTLDLPEMAPRVGVPVAFLLGRQDHQCPPESAVRYLEALDAPEKSLSWFEQSAHNIPFEQPAAFNQTVSKFVQRWS